MSTQEKLFTVIIFGSFMLMLSTGEALAQSSLPPKKTPDLLNQGKKLYEQNCSPCHGVKGDGKGPASTALKPAPSDFAEPLTKWPNTKGKPEKIFGVISKGIPNSAMVKWNQFPETERWGLVYFVMEFAAKSSGPKKK
ncbi:MAG TPA: cytochrome c [Thermodesulfobacteriota bacterium]|nr:cytochrome c [Thermodesulfobacteriota bacterium]